MSELGCAFLFLLAGYEISPRALTSKDGRRGFTTWLATLVLGIAVAFILPHIAEGRQGIISTGLLFTTTALGTLMPILKDRGILGTRVGDLVIAYGTWGELAAVIAVVILLSTRQPWVTTAILLALLLLCVWIAVLGKRAITTGNRIYKFFEEKSESTSQTFFRLTMFVLILLVAFSAIFNIDIVLGAFAAGFILRFLTRNENESLMAKINGTAYGFFIPLFFIVSGAGIDLSAVTQMPGLLIMFIVALVAVRAVPIIVSLSLEKDEAQRLSMHNRISVAFYSTTALPLIVAITNITVNRGIMSSNVASVLVAAGAVTVFLMPLIGQITYKVVDAEPIHALVEIVHTPKNFQTILREHLELERERTRKYRKLTFEHIHKRIESIENADERQEMRELFTRFTREDTDLMRAHAASIHTMRARHQEEFRHVYRKYHQGDAPAVMSYIAQDTSEE